MVKNINRYKKYTKMAYNIHLINKNTDTDCVLICFKKKIQNYEIFIYICQSNY